MNDKEQKSVMTGDLEKNTESLDSIIEKFEGSKGVRIHFTQ